MRRIGTLFITLIQSGLIIAQVINPPDGFIYSDLSLPRIDITISNQDLQDLYNNPYEDTEFTVNFKFTRDGTVEIVTDAGIRIRGNTSRNKQKKSFKISFNTFVPGQDFQGVEKMNINAETNDPSMLRSILSNKLFRYLGVPAPRSNHILLFINNSFYGVYINTEHVDEQFVKSRFDSNDGNLYKCLWPADLAYLGDDEDLYKFIHNDRRVYELHINEEWDDCRDLVALTKVIHDYSGEQFRMELERVLNVPQYLKAMAVDVMTGNWDGYIGNKNNYYLYRDPLTGRFEYIPYDLDNTLGIDWLGEDWGDRSIYSWNREERILYEKILQVQKYRDQYTAYIKKLAAYMQSDELNRYLLRIRSQISGWVSQDTFYPLDWGYSYTDFEQALTEAFGDHVKYSIMDYIDTRTSTALAEAQETDAFPLITYARFETSDSKILTYWMVEDDENIISTALHFRIDGSSWQTLTAGGPEWVDTASGSLLYLDSVRGMAENSVVDLYLTATDQSGQTIQYPASFHSVRFPVINGPLLINEFMASNSVYRADEYGEYDDWLEIYNASDEPVWLGDVFLSDDKGDPGKYRFPDRYIDPGGFYLVWTDGTPDQGPNHTPFRLNQDGEEIRLSQGPATGYRMMDFLEYGSQNTDVASGRLTDGGEEWITFIMPTPGFSNLLTYDEQVSKTFTELKAYPNPIRTGTLYFSKHLSGSVFDITGREVKELDNTNQIDVTGFRPGIYLVSSREGGNVKFVVR